MLSAWTHVRRMSNAIRADRGQLCLEMGDELGPRARIAARHGIRVAARRPTAAPFAGRRAHQLVRQSRPCRRIRAPKHGNDPFDTRAVSLLGKHHIGCCRDLGALCV